MIIPIRVPADASPHIIGGIRYVTDDHPLFDTPCPACDNVLGGSALTLVYVGARPDSRKPTGWMTGSAVAVHAVCAGLDLEDYDHADVLGHIYLSTSCFHGDHDYCQNNTGLAGSKTPAQCKLCDAPCVCWCHADNGKEPLTAPR